MTESKQPETGITLEEVHNLHKKAVGHSWIIGQYETARLRDLEKRVGELERVIKADTWVQTPSDLNTKLTVYQDATDCANTGVSRLEEVIEELIHKHKRLVGRVEDLKARLDNHLEEEE